MAADTPMLQAVSKMAAFLVMRIFGVGVSVSFERLFIDSCFQRVRFNLLMYGSSFCDCVQWVGRRRLTRHAPAAFAIQWLTDLITRLCDTSELWYSDTRSVAVVQGNKAHCS